MAQQPIVFDYDKFYYYYTNPTNLSMDASKNVKFYHKGQLYYGTKSGTYITINGKQIFVDETFDNSGVYFSTIRPSTEPGVFWDDHFHFGKQYNFPYTDRIARTKHIASKKQRFSRKYKNPPPLVGNVVYFHQTLQIDDRNKTK